MTVDPLFRGFKNKHTKHTNTQLVVINEDVGAKQRVESQEVSTHAQK